MPKENQGFLKIHFEEIHKFRECKHSNITWVISAHITTLKEENDVHKHCFGMGLMKNNMRYELACKSPTNKMVYVHKTPQS